MKKIVLKIKKIWKYSFLLSLIIKHQDKNFRKRLENTSFTLLAPNCMAGLIYHRLGERFNSPTIDTSMATNDFIYMINNLDYYMDEDVYEYKKVKAPYPVGIIYGNDTLPDIRVNFVHYDTFEQGRKKWNERKTRIIKNNLYILLCDINDIYEEDSSKAGYISDEMIAMLERVKCNNRALLTRNPNNNKPYAVYIEPERNKPFPLVYMNRDILGLNKFEKEFDFVSFLNVK